MNNLKSKIQTDLINDATKWRLLTHKRAEVIIGLAGKPYEVHLKYTNKNPEENTLVGHGSSLDEALTDALTNRRVRKMNFSNK